jgi:hypothetical protein
MKSVTYRSGLCSAVLLCVLTVITYGGGAPASNGETEAGGLAKGVNGARAESATANNEPRTGIPGNDPQPTTTPPPADNAKPWYRDPDIMGAIGSLGAVIISVLALYVSSRSQSVQQVREKREELRGVLERLITLREEQVATGRLKDEVEKAITSGYMNTKRAVYLEAAESIAKQIPKSVTASEYYVLGLENYWDSDFVQARMYYRTAAEKSRDSAPTKQSEIWRCLAGTYFLQDPALLDVKEGRKCLEQSLTVLEGRTDYYSSYVRTLAYRDWGYAELLYKNYADSATLLDKAYNEWLKIPEDAGFFRVNEIRIIANYLRMVGEGYCQEVGPNGGRNIAQGRETFQKALEILRALNNKYGVSNDYVTDAMAITYQAWGQQEISAGFKEQGLQLLEEAKKCFMDLSESYAWRASRRLGIDALLLQFAQRDTEPTPSIGQPDDRAAVMPAPDPNHVLDTDTPKIGLPQ